MVPTVEMAIFRPFTRHDPRNYLESIMMHFHYRAAFQAIHVKVASQVDSPTDLFMVVAFLASFQLVLRGTPIFVEGLVTTLTTVELERSEDSTLTLRMTMGDFTFPGFGLCMHSALLQMYAILSAFEKLLGDTWIPFFSSCVFKLAFLLGRFDAETALTKWYKKQDVMHSRWRQYGLGGRWNMALSVAWFGQSCCQ